MVAGTTATHETTSTERCVNEFVSETTCGEREDDCAEGDAEARRVHQQTQLARWKKTVSRLTERDGVGDVVEYIFVWTPSK